MISNVRTLLGAEHFADPEVQAAKTYSIGDVAKACGAAVRTVRQWERDGKIAPPGRSKGNQRRYTEAEMDLITEKFRRVPKIVMTRPK
jgi:predicted site-specific integrase-resolvase